MTRMSPGRIRSVLAFLAGSAGPAGFAEALAARNAVVHVSRRCAGPGCLQRSIATFLLCRIRGTVPEWCTGVRVSPFRAHAWVEVDGSPVGELGEVRHFHKVMTVRPVIVVRDDD